MSICAMAYKATHMTMNTKHCHHVWMQFVKHQKGRGDLYASMKIPGPQVETAGETSFFLGGGGWCTGRCNHPVE